MYLEFDNMVSNLLLAAFRVLLTCLLSDTFCLSPAALCDLILLLQLLQYSCFFHFSGQVTAMKYSMELNH